jgi:hypothetical protein
VNAEDKEVLAWADVILPDGQEKRAFFPQAYTSMFLENLPEGRPDLYIQPPYSEGEFHLGFYYPFATPQLSDSLMEYLCQSASNWDNEGAFVWPLEPDPNGVLQNLFEGMESPDIWIDEGPYWFVDRWTPRDDPGVIGSIRVGQDNAEFSPYDGSFLGVEGQGDMFYTIGQVRVWVLVRNIGEADSPEIPQGLNLYAYDYYDIHDWELLGTTDIPALGAHASSYLYVELMPSYIGLPPHTLSERHLVWIPKQWPSTDEYYEGVWRAHLKIELAASETERHTNNNTSTEMIIVRADYPSWSP